MASIRPAKLADAVADHIKQMILDGSLRPGERLLPERELALKLDVSRPSLRDALDKLSGEGLLTSNAQGSAFVSEDIGKSFRDPLEMMMDTPEARFDCLELRSVVEGAAAALAAERASRIDRDELKRCYEAMEAAHERQDVEEIARTDAEFHFAIYEASHNLMLLHLMRSIENILRSNVYLNRKNLYEHHVQRDSQLTEHKAICDAILARDAEGARAAALVHMTTAIRTQREIHEAERRLQASIRRLGRSDIVAADKRRASSAS